MNHTLGSRTLPSDLFYCSLVLRHNSSLLESTGQQLGLGHGASGSRMSVLQSRDMLVALVHPCLAIPSLTPLPQTMAQIGVCPELSWKTLGCSKLILAVHDVSSVYCNARMVP